MRCSRGALPLVAAGVAMVVALAAASVVSPDAGAGSPKYAWPTVGDALTIKSYDEYVRITVLRVETSAAIPAGVDAAIPGLRFVAVQLRIANLSQERYNDAPGNGAVLITDTNRSYRTTLPGEEPNLDELPAIPPESFHTGWLTFLVPERAQIWKFRFTLDSGYVPQHADWLLTRPRR
jgi:hypothetical protein